MGAGAWDSSGTERATAAPSNYTQTSVIRVRKKELKRRKGAHLDIFLPTCGVVRLGQRPDTVVAESIKSVNKC